MSNNRSWTTWRRHFESNTLRPLPVIAPLSLSSEMIASLQHFQLGETGEGRIAKQIDDYFSPAIDDDYRAALKLFIKEEGRHARILAALLKVAGADTLKKSASASAFTIARGLVGVRFKLVVLLVAEVVAVEAYPMLAESAGAARPLLEEIAADERQHLRFHTAFFSRALRGPKRWIFPPLFLSIALVAASLCAFEHRRTLGRAPLAAVRAMWLRARRVLRSVLAREEAPEELNEDSSFAPTAIAAIGRSDGERASNLDAGAGRVAELRRAAVDSVA